MYIAAHDARLFALAFGPRHPEAPVLLALGGWVGSWELWAEPMARLSAEWRTIGIDHRGTGATVCPPAAITFEAMVADVFRVLEAFEVDQCVLAAESAGASVAVAAALRHPERFTGLVLVDGLITNGPRPANDPFRAALYADYAQTIDRFVEACAPEPNHALIRQWGRLIVNRASPEAGRALYDALDGIDLWPDLGRLTLPTLLLHETGDPFVPVASARALAQALPNAQLVELPGRGHVPTLTQPEAVAEAIDAFFRLR